MKKAIFLVISLLKLVSSFGQVNLQTGSATYSVPMFSWQDDKSRLNGVVGLNYNSGSGLKTGDVASNIGQGWNLIAGGIITRIQIGEPDDQVARSVNNLTDYPAGYLYNTISADQGCPTALARYPLYKDKNHVYKQLNSVAADREMDRFAFQFNGKSGVFVLDKYGQDVGAFIGDNNMKVRFVRDPSMTNQGVRTTITAFYITDDDGLIYKFSVHELAKVLKVNYCDENLQVQNTQPDFKDGKVYNEASFVDNQVVNPYIVTGWHLSEILDPLTNRKIEFNYPYVSEIDASSGSSFAFYRDKNYSVISHLRSITKTPSIGSISFPDGHEVRFNYGDLRVDLNGDRIMSSVDVTYQSRYLSRYEFQTRYFILNRYGSTATEDYEKRAARLCLEKVTKIGVDLKENDNPYVFDYYTGSSTPDDVVPPPFFHIKDIWGYYNGNNSIVYEDNNNNSNIPVGIAKSLKQLTNNEIIGLCFIKYGQTSTVLNAKPGYAKNGLLKSITYPTGGRLTYEYAQNTGILNSQNTNVGGVHVSRTLLVDGGYSNDCTHPLTTNYYYRDASNNSLSSVWGLTSPVNYMTMRSHYAPEDKYVRYRPPFSVTCDYRYRYPGIISREQSVSLTTGQKNLQILSTVLDVISSILTVVDIVNVIIAATPAAIAAVMIDYISTVVTFIISCVSNVDQNDTNHIYYNSDIYASNPLPTQFKRVVVEEGGGENGRTEYEFTSDDDYALWEPLNPSLSMQQRFAYWAYGLLKKKTEYDANGVPKALFENVYDWTKAKSNFAYDVSLPEIYPSCKCLVNKTSSQRNTNWEVTAESVNLTSSNYEAGLEVKVYQVYSGRVELKRSIQRSYQSGSSTKYLETSTDYLYHPINFQVNKITTTQSNGDINYKDVAYTYDFNSISIFNSLFIKNILTLPVSTLNSVKKAGTNTIQYLNEEVTEYQFVPNGDLKVSRMLERRFSAPQISSGFNRYHGPGQSNNPTDYKQTQLMIYDPSSNLVGVKDEGDRVVTNIYGYEGKFVTASVINADPIADKTAYTSFETFEFGGWSISGSFSILPGSFATGNRALNLTTSNSLSTQINSAKTYTLSFYSPDPNISVSGNAVLQKSQSIGNGLLYMEYEIPTGNSSVALHGNAIIDEVRLYPKGARMRTVTYDPLVGKTSECDENGRITYYDYDNLGRLKFVKDEQRNIVKMYEYNYASTPPVCAITYRNFLIKEIFKKTTSSPGQVGSDVWVTVDADKYSSTISQADADLQAEYELMTEGQARADSLGSIITIFTNDSSSGSFERQGCDVGTVGTSYQYSVPAGRYTSQISQANADSMALTEIAANGQTVANLLANASCMTSSESVWIGTGFDSCSSGHKFLQVKDQNSNSSIYNQLMWIDGGLDSTCQPNVLTSLLENYRQTDPYRMKVFFALPDQIDTSATLRDTRLLYRDSVCKLPDQYRQIPFSSTGWFTGFNMQLADPYSNQPNLEQFCFMENGYSVEWRVKMPRNSYNGNVLLLSSYFEFTVQFLRTENGIYLYAYSDFDGHHYGHEYGGTGFDYIRVADADALDVFQNIRLKLTKTRYYVYFNDVVIADYPRNNNVNGQEVPIDKHFYISTLFLGNDGALDHIKVFDSQASSPVFEENFSNPSQPTYPSTSLVCPAPPNCETAFTAYFNQHLGTSYTFAQISALYSQTTGHALDVCSY